MKQNNRYTRGLAIFTGSVLAASAFVAPAPAKADKADKIKIGATVLGAAAVILGAKGKTVPAIIAGAAGVYAYKKGRDEDRKKNDYPAYGQAGQYPQYPNTSYPTTYPSNNYPAGTTYPSGTTYPNYGNNYPTYGNSPTTSYPTNNYPSNSYPTYNQPTAYPNYPSGGYGGNNSNCRDNGNYNGGYYGNSRAATSQTVVPQAVAPAPRSNRHRENQRVVLR